MFALHLAQGDDTEQVKRKRALLEAEGVHFDGSKVAGSCVLSQELLGALVQAGA